ncbi:hypothetical protein T492DRAFT_888755 [Pavlovales sp. CCMP2436]|nr:hypothetical protein T492DRAFT_888755 [Pavlovales sp. CCMP2436]
MDVLWRRPFPTQHPTHSAKDVGDVASWLNASNFSAPRPLTAPDRDGRGGRAAGRTFGSLSPPRGPLSRSSNLSRNLLRLPQSAASTLPCTLPGFDSHFASLAADKAVLRSPPLGERGAFDTGSRTARGRGDGVADAESAQLDAAKRVLAAATRSVSLHCAERGDLLSRVARDYAQGARQTVSQHAAERILRAEAEHAQVSMMVERLHLDLETLGTKTEKKLSVLDKFYLSETNDDSK